MYLFNAIKGLRKIPYLSKVAKGVSHGPLISVIIAAKDEEESIEKTLTHLYEQNYKNLEIIVVNDRSDDETGKIIEQFKERISNDGNVSYQTVHIQELPKDWLGKNHALYQGYLVSKGEYLVFTDADIVFKKETISKTMDYVVANHVEHMAMIPYIICNNFALRSFIHLFLLYFCIFVEPWKVYVRGKKGKGVGVGAFNLIKRDVYMQLGTHRTFPLHPIDDIELGKKAKEMQCNQHFLIGKELIEVEWYPSLKDAIKGFEKNFFGALDYKFWKVIGFTFLQCLFAIYPFIGLLFNDWMLIVHILSLTLLCLLYVSCIRKVSFGSTLEFLLLPITVSCYIYTLFRSAYLTLRRGGINWRGTFYSLKELKELNAK